MSIPAGKVAILDNVGAAMRDWRAHMRLNVITGLIGAAALTALTLAAIALVGNPSMTLLLATVNTIAEAFIYSTFLVANLKGEGQLRSRLLSDGARVWASMVVVGFFLFVVFIVAAIPGFALIITAMAPYAPELQRAGEDPAALMPIMQRFAEANAGLLFALLLIYGLVWILLTSRLYLAAPGTVGAGRILSFETWSWTKNNMWRITAARLTLLAPALILSGAIRVLVGAALGVDVLNSTVMPPNLITFAITHFVGFTVTIALYRGLEAALSARLYKGLQPQN